MGFSDPGIRMRGNPPSFHHRGARPTDNQSKDAALGIGDRKAFLLSGECPTMNRVVMGCLEVLPDFEQANRFVDHLPNREMARILVTHEIDWSWTRILEHFEGLIANQGTRVSRGAEVLAIMDKPGVLGTQTATQMLCSGSQGSIRCHGNRGRVYVLPHKPT
jgi:phosphoenolpyruvate synthase/pyruvate phosphate dikinase